MIPETTPEFWHSIKENDNVILGDEATRKARMEAGKGPTPESYRVASVMTVRNASAEWRFILLDEPNGIVLVVKTVDAEMSLFVMRESEAWTPVTRQEILGTELDFVFQVPPEDQIDPEKGFIGDPNSLKFATALKDDKGTEYSQKPQGEQNGRISFSPLRSGVSDWVATVVEYISESAVDSEAMVLEVGSPSSGVIKILTGKPLSGNDIKVMKQ